MWLGLDIGTSAVKAVLVDADDAVVSEASHPVPVSRPRQGWSEQDPADWWSATDAAVRSLDPHARAAVRAVGLAGQMHGATLLDAQDRVLRPAILWNDGRAEAECTELEAAAPDSRAITGNAAMPGFTAPKLLWVRRHEPEVFRATARVLLPKDHVRLQMTGDYATDVADASGTLWLDVSRRRWSAAMLGACGLDERAMPGLFEGTQFTGALRPEVAADWGMPAAPVAAGGGDNAAGAVGSGVVAPGDAFLSLGTSGVLFAAGDRFQPVTDSGAHAFCHALPERWCQMAVILSAASALTWATRACGFADERAALAAAARHAPFAGPELFLPYLSGERTPHNDPHTRGAWIALDHDSDPGRLIMAVLEGVAFAFADGWDALAHAGTAIRRVSVIGGGARSELWGRILASALDQPLDHRQDAHLGPAFGAARLARVAGGEDITAVATPPLLERQVPPDPVLRARALPKLARFRALYPALKGL